ncbi:unnamed protein product [Phaedon cochleariae]|uniref:Integral membrane protein 2 n=1 Tax=Phaedon cochleariae TaxID=80249 RepID=A0A9N9S9C6_PHACE|nr:unnamed protein product [Phaedon cochleariae]
MTILTKSFSEKKSDNSIAPLVLNEQLPPPTAPGDVEAQTFPAARLLVFPSRAHRVSTATTLCLLVTALVVVGVGIVGGKVLYDEYLSVSRHRARFEGWAQIPMSPGDEYDDLLSAESSLTTERFSDPEWMRDDPSLKAVLSDYFQENFEIDEDERYEKIDVPDFRDGRSGRFVHDFNSNTTGIIDASGGRCFVMPLNRDNVLPPKSMLDLVQKMWAGYYKVDTDLVRKSMRVVLPPVEDTKTIGVYIASECEGFPIYKLEKFVGGVVKRSADLHTDAKFAQFAGKGITQIDIMNLEEVYNYEKSLRSASSS